MLRADNGGGHDGVRGDWLYRRVEEESWDRRVAPSMLCCGDQWHVENRVARAGCRFPRSVVFGQRQIVVVVVGPGAARWRCDAITRPAHQSILYWFIPRALPTDGLPLHFTVFLVTFVAIVLAAKPL